MAFSRKYFLVDVSGAATLLALQALVTAGVAACIAAGGFVPEAVESETQLVLSSGSRRDCLAFLASIAPFQDWIGVTDAVVNLVPVSGQPTLAAIQALIDADGVAMGATATPSARNAVRLTADVGGNQSDLLAILYTDGAPAVS